MVNVLIAVLGAFGIFLLVDAFASLLPVPRLVRRDRLQEAMRGREGVAGETFSVTQGMPFLDRLIRGVVEDLSSLSRKKEDLEDLIRRTGGKYKSVGDLYAARVLFAALFFAGGVAGLIILEEPGLFPLPLVAGILGYNVPILELRGELKARHQAIMTEMPFLLERLARTMESGLSLVDAMLRVTEVPTGFLSAAMRRLAVGLATGIEDAHTYFDRFAGELPEDYEIAGLVSRLQAGLMGGRVVEALLIQAGRVRSKLASQTLARGQRAIIAVTVVGGGLMLPALLLLMIGPAIVMAARML